MGDETRDNWSKLDILAKAVSALLLPLVIFYFTIQQQKASEGRLNQEKANEVRRLEQQREADLAQRNADRTANLLKNLASDNKRERLLTIKLIGYFTDSKQLPSEVKPVLISTFLDDADQDVKNAAEEILKEAKEEFKEPIYFVAQKILKDLKYYNGEINGLADQFTRNAVVEFQRDNELPKDGIVGVRTLQKLKEVKEEFKKSIFVAQRIFVAQKILKDLKYYNGEINGLADQFTVDAIIKFQKDNKLPADGDVGVLTLLKLKEQQGR